MKSDLNPHLSATTADNVFSENAEHKICSTFNLANRTVLDTCDAGGYLESIGTHVGRSHVSRGEAEKLKCIRRLHNLQKTMVLASCSDRVCTRYKPGSYRELKRDAYYQGGKLIRSYAPLAELYTTEPASSFPRMTRAPHG